jgi:hypothetical protein
MFWRIAKAELHNQRLVFYSGWALAVLIYAFFHIGSWRNPDLNFIFLHLISSLICMAFSSFAGSLTYNRNNSDSRISMFRFLLKLVVGAFSATISGMLVVIALALSVQLNSGDIALDVLVDSLYPDFAYLPHSVIYFFSSFIVFACSVFFSFLLFRHWLSALMGFAIGTSIVCSTAFFWLRLDFRLWEEDISIVSAMFLCGVLLLFCARGFSCYLNRLRSSTRFVLGLLSLLTTTFASLVLIFSMRSSPGPFLLREPNLSPMGTVVVSEAYGDGNRQIWTIPTEPGRGRRIVKKHAYDAEISPNGRWIAYFSQRGIFDLRSFYVDLRATKIDDTQENILLPRFTRWRNDEDDIGVDGKAFSPDSKYIALLCYTMIYVVDREGSIKSLASLPPNSHKQLLGWRPNSLEVLLVDYSRRCIETYDVAKREFKPLYYANQKHTRSEVPIHSDAGIRYVVFGNELVDVDRGSAQPFPEDIGKGSLDISTDQSTLIYSISSEELKPDASSASIHRFEIKTSRDELYARFRGVIIRLVNSPDGNKIAFERRTEFNQLQTVVMTGNSLVRKFEGWALIGWRDSGRVVLADNNLFPKRMALGNIATGQVHQFYP